MPSSLHTPGSQDSPATPSRHQILPPPQILKVIRAERYDLNRYYAKADDGSE